jgi:putative membrane protein
MDGMNTSRRYLSLRFPVTLAVLSCCTIAIAQTSATQPRTRVAANKAEGKSMLKHGDRNFIEDAAKAGMAEVAISQIAAEKAMDPQVKEFARMMVNDHGGANTELTTLAGSKNVMLPTKQPNTDKWTKKKAGKDFDEDYMEKMVDEHDNAVEHFEREVKRGDDADVKAFAAKMLPTLQAHHARAKEIKKALK